MFEVRLGVRVGGSVFRVRSGIRGVFKSIFNLAGKDD